MSNCNRKPMKLFEMLTMVVGTMVGMGIFIVPVLTLSSGFYGPVSCMIAGMLCVGLSMMFGELSKMNAVGGPAGFAYKAFGRMMSLRVAILHWMGFTAAQILTVYTVGLYFNQTFAYAVGITTLVLISLINLYKPSIAERMQTIFTVLKIALIFFIIIAGLRVFSFSDIKFIPMSCMAKSNLLLSGVASSLIAFAGLELATLPSCEIENPKFTVPAATILGTIITALLSAMSYLVIVNALLKFEIVVGSRPVYDAVNIFAGKFVTVFVIAFVISCLSSVNGILNAQAYVLKNAADLRLLPDFIGEINVNGKSTAAVLLSVVVSIVCLALMKFNIITFGQVGFISGTAFTLVYLYSTFSYLKLSGLNVLSAINIVISILLLYGIYLSASTYLFGAIALILGIDIVTAIINKDK